ncbi:MAG: TolC family protein [Ignavibacteria bacterium]|jgi:outer membrane protein|nr:TolC family protein [Ignavibacteria bacterium]
MIFISLEKVMKFSALIILIAVSSTLKAQQVKTINNVEQAINLAYKNNSSIITAKLDRLKAQERVSEAYSDNLFPSINLNSRFQRAIRKQVLNIGDQQFEVGSDNSFTNLIDVRESLPILGTPVFAAIRIADYYEKTQEQNITKTEIDVKKNVKTAYYSVLLSKSIVDVNKITQKNSEDNFITVEKKYKIGTATEFDYLRAKVRLDNSNPQLSESERNYEISRKILLNEIGLKDQQDIEVQGELTYDSTEVFQTTDQMIENIAKNNIEVKQLEVLNSINKELVKIDKANYLPKLSVFAQYTLFSNENDGQPIMDYRFGNTLFVGLGLDWNLNLFRNSYKVNQSEIEVKKNDEQLAQLKQGLKLRAESSIIALEDAKERITSRRNTVKLAERALELANVSYQAGVINLLDVQAAELSLSESRLAFLQAIYDYQIAKAEIEKLLQE